MLKIFLLFIFFSSTCLYASALTDKSVFNLDDFFTSEESFNFLQNDILKNRLLSYFNEHNREFKDLSKDKPNLLGFKVFSQVDFYSSIKRESLLADLLQHKLIKSMDCIFFSYLYEKVMDNNRSPQIIFYIVAEKDEKSEILSFTFRYIPSLHQYVLIRIQHDPQSNYKPSYSNAPQYPTRVVKKLFWKVDENSHFYLGAQDIKDMMQGLPDLTSTPEKSTTIYTYQNDQSLAVENARFRWRYHDIENNINLLNAQAVINEIEYLKNILKKSPHLEQSNPSLQRFIQKTMQYFENYLIAQATANSRSQ